MQSTKCRLKMTQESDLEKAALLAGINNAIPLLGEYEKEPGVLASPPDRIACLLQTAFARWATEKQSLEELPIGNALEAKFDGDDWHWVRTLWWMMKGAEKFAFYAPPKTRLPSHFKLRLLLFRNPRFYWP